MAMQQEWSSGLFACFDDVGVCLFTCFCPCVQYGKNDEMLTGNSCVTPCLIWFCCAECSCFCAGPQRTKLRELYLLPETCGNDCLATCCCPYCTICQATRELNKRGNSGAGGGPSMQSMRFE